MGNGRILLQGLPAQKICIPLCAVFPVNLINIAAPADNGTFPSHRLHAADIITINMQFIRGDQRHDHIRSGGFRPLQDIGQILPAIPLLVFQIGSSPKHPYWNTRLIDGFHKILDLTVWKRKKDQ